MRIRPVILISSNGQKEHSIGLEVHEEGIRLHEMDGEVSKKLLETFPFECIKKWVPSNLRSRNPGGRDCLDIQIQTSKGAKDLRIRASSAKEVQDIVKQMRDAAQGELVLRTGAHTPRSGTMSPAATLYSLSGHRRGLSPVRGRPGVPEYDIGQPASARAASGEAQLEELQKQNKFLEEMVRRLSVEMSRQQQQQQPHGKQADTLDLHGEGAKFMEGLGDEAPLPVWITEERYMSPLLLAYDNRILGLERDLNSKVQDLEGFRSEVSQVVNENEKLRGDLEHHVDLLAAKTAEGEARACAGPDPDEARDLSERLELLSQENDLLVKQQGELDQEVQKLHEQLQARSAENLTISRDLTDATASLRAKEELLAETQTKYDKVKEGWKRTTEKIEGLQEQLEEAQQSLAREQGSVTDARGAMEALFKEHLALQQQMADMQSSSKDAAGSMSTLTAEAATWRERYDSAARDAESARQQAEELRSALAALEAKLLEYQHKDAENGLQSMANDPEMERRALQVYSRIREAMEAAEQAKLARDASMAREKQLKRELESLQRRLMASRSDARSSMENEFSSSMAALEADLKAAQQRLAETEDELAASRALTERLQREKASTLRELRGVLDGESVPSGAAGGASGPSTAQLKAMELLQQAQHERDEAVEKLESTQRQHARLGREWELQRQQLEASMHQMRTELTSVDGISTTAKSDAAGYLRQLESARRELSTVKAAKQRSEQELASQLAVVRAQRDSEVKAMASKLESAVESYNKAVSEAEHMLDAKEALLSRWRDEATQAATRLERDASVYQSQLESRDQQLAELKAQVASLQAESSHLQQQLGAASSSSAALRPALDDVSRRASQVQIALAEAEAQQAELKGERRQLQDQLERAVLERARAERQRDTLAQQVESLKTNNNNLQEMLSGRSSGLMNAGAAAVALG